MRALLVVALTMSTTPVFAKDAWHCRNTIEVTCNKNTCESTTSFTPMDIDVSATGAMEVCAYSGCWQGTGRYRARDGFLVWTAQDLKFSTGTTKASIAILIDPRDGVGLIKVDGFAEPVNCVKE